jgi:hypothetical protein
MRCYATHPAISKIMLNSISAAMYQSRSMEYKPYPTFLVDEKPLYLWLSQRIDLNVIDVNAKKNTSYGDYVEIEKGSLIRNDIIEYLVPAQGWLIDDNEMKTAWERITPSSTGFTTIVPLLIDEEYVSFSSYAVFVAEQEVSDDFIAWCRFGFSMDCSHDRVGGTVKWLETLCTAKFHKAEYIDALNLFKTLCITEWV